MPRQKLPKSLQALGIERIARMLHSLNKVSLPDDFPWLVENPFICFHGYILENIWQHLTELLYRSYRTREYVNKNIFLILLCRKLKAINLSCLNFQPDDIVELLNVISKNGSDLKHLHINSLCYELFSSSISVMGPSYRFRNCTGYSLKNFISTMNSLTILSMNTICNDQLLKAAGKGCPNLIRLDAFSLNVTDRGLYKLCIRTNENGDKVLQCQKLKKISLCFDAEGISHRGIQILLRCLPQLETIDNPPFYSCKPSKILTSMHFRDYNTCGKVYQLKDFCYDWERELSPNIPDPIPQIVIKICPFITILTLVNPICKQMIEFANLRCLENFKVLSYNHSNKILENGLLPLLQIIGKNLQTLHVDLSENVDILTIGSLCPNLNEFACSSVEKITASSKCGPLLNLKKLKITSPLSDSLSPEECQRMLFLCQNLEMLTLHGCTELTDEELKQMFEANRLDSLRVLNVELIPGVTENVIEQLILLNNELKEIHFQVSFPKLNKEMLKQIERTIKANNLDVRVMFSEC